MESVIQPPSAPASLGVEGYHLSPLTLTYENHSHTCQYYTVDGSNLEYIYPDHSILNQLNQCHEKLYINHPAAHDYTKQHENSIHAFTHPWSLYALRPKL